MRKVSSLTEIDVHDLKQVLTNMEDVIKFSFKNNLNLHSSIGGKYGELYVAYELMPHVPLLGKRRDEARGCKNPCSADMILKKTGKKVEVKWGALHYTADDYYFRTRGRTEYWGWGFSKGTQFLNDKFDYCVLLCAEKNGAKPVYVYVVTANEMRNHMIKRISGEGGRKKTSYFLEVSDDPEFFHKRQNQNNPIELCKLEKLIRDNLKYRERWKILKKHGKLIEE
jgi:hypothetical protein